MAGKRGRAEVVDVGSGLVTTALARFPGRRAEVEAMVRRVERGRHDARAVGDAGRAIDELMEGKRYRILGHATLGALLASIGVARSTAYEWRAVGREVGAGAGGEVVGKRRRRGIRPASARSMRVAEEEARELRKRLAGHGVEARVMAFDGDGVAQVKIEVGVRGARVIG